MDKLVKGRWAMTVVLAAMAVTLIGTSAVQADDEAPNKGRISVSAGVDYVSQYWYRGLAQENQDYIFQPWAGIGVNLFSDENADALNSVDVNFGVWTSFHGGPSGDGAPAGSGITDPMAWWETDFYVGLNFTVFKRIGLGVTYTALTSPNDGFLTVDDLAFSVSYDDAGLWGDGILANGLQPSAKIAFEIGDNGADAGANTGIYYELAFGPSWDNVVGPVGLSVPFTFGFGSDFYEDGLGNDDTFGYFDVGADFSLPLDFIPSDFGSWTLTAGVHMIVLGDSASNIAGPAGFGVTGGSNTEVYGKCGISFEY